VVPCAGRERREEAPLNAECRKVQRIYLTLELLHTLAASFIWGINTLFLLDAGLSNAEAFAANAFFTAGLVLFEVPTGVVADTRGRRTSYLVGTLTLAVSTLLYLWMWRITAPLWAWALASGLLGFGFTFFSGAVEAWLVDALAASGFDGKLESVFAKGEIVQGIAMLGGSVAGGAVAQVTNLGVPYVLRVILLALTFLCAFAWMRDLGFTPRRGKRPLAETKRVLRGAVEHGLANPPVRWLMLAGFFSGGVLIYAFYAMQPYLLDLYGDEEAYGIAGLAAAVVAGAQILGGLSVPLVGRVFRRRTTVLLAGGAAGSVFLAMIGIVPAFWPVLALLVLWGLLFSAVTPIRQAYLNALVPSDQRATVLSFDSMLASGGGVVVQPALGRAADVWSYPASYVLAAGIDAMALPFLWLARRERTAADSISDGPARRDHPE
jgi:MFS family permease